MLSHVKLIDIIQCNSETTDFSLLFFTMVHTMDHVNVYIYIFFFSFFIIELFLEMLMVFFFFFFEKNVNGILLAIIYSINFYLLNKKRGKDSDCANYVQLISPIM